MSTTGTSRAAASRARLRAVAVLPAPGSTLTTATKKIKGPVTHAWIEGGDHGLRRKDDQVVETVRDWVDALLRDGLS